MLQPYLALQAATVPGPVAILPVRDPALTIVFDPDIGSDIGSDHVTRSCYSIMLLIHVTRSCYSFLLLDPVTHSCYSIRSVLIDSPQQSDLLHDRSLFRPCRFNRQVHASISIYQVLLITLWNEWKKLWSQCHKLQQVK